MINVCVCVSGFIFSICVSASVYVYMCLSQCVSVFVFVCLAVSVYVSVCLQGCITVYLCLRVCLCFPVFVSIYKSDSANSCTSVV